MMIAEQILNNAPNPLLHIADGGGSALFNVDCMDILPLIPDKSVQLILADLPYGTTNLKWDSVLDLNKLWQEYERIITDNGAIVLTASQPFTTVLINSNPTLFKYEWIWLKDKPNNFALANKMPMKYHENVLVFYKKQPKYNKQMERRDGGGKRYKYAVNYENQQSEHLTLKNGKKFFDMELKNPSSVQKFSTGRRQDLKHPTQKPLEMMEYFIATYSDENDYVLDNTMGSGTTCLAAKELNRKFIGIEKEVKYYDLAVTRVFG
jgi:site-specific DNA-methyltransferase (adenine-specific)